MKQTEQLKNITPQNFSERILEWITEEEAIVLDGITANPKIISFIKKIKTKKSLSHSTGDAFTDTVISKINEIKILKPTYESSRYIGYTICFRCKKSLYSYPLYKSGQKKGQQNYSKKIFSTNLHLGGYTICRSCQKELNTKYDNDFIGWLKSYFLKYSNDFQIEFEESKWKVEKSYICKQCNTIIWEYDIKPLPALMGGLYPGECPNCMIQNIFFGPLIFLPNKEIRTVLKNSLFKKENLWLRRNIAKTNS